MSQERERVLDLLAAGKITVEEAGRLLDAIEAREGLAEPRRAATVLGGSPGGTPRYLYVKVLSVKGDNVNIKIPLRLIRAGLKLTSLIPQSAMDQINKSMAEHGLSIDLKDLKSDDLEELLQALRETEINVDAANGDNVRVYAA